jgi:Asp-tRNA(Asn)/Glu-tRNA(Gln) amidotransferase A subunit family amidase
MPRTPRLARRTWLKLMPALATAASSQMPVSAQEAASGSRVTAPMLRQVLAAAGLEFKDGQIEMMLPGANRYLASYESLRKLEINESVPPAAYFVPVLPGQSIPKGPSQFKQVAPSVPALPSKDDLAFLPALELGALVRARKVTPLELTNLYLDRLKAFGPKLLCVISLTEDLARAQAERFTTEIKRGQWRGPLHGVPYGAKDLFDTKGIATTWGAEPYQNRVPTSDATIVTRLEKAGAILLAKLSMGALAQGGLWFKGMTKTPWNLEMTSSGSSAGSGSATAAGLVGFAIGTETLGSIISPSTRCGITGLRPTFGRVSRAGAMALSWSMDKVGPMCRSVEDCAEVLRAIAGPDNLDPTVIDAPLHWDPNRTVKTLKVGYLAKEFEQAPPALKPVYEEALKTLRSAGVNLQPMALPEAPLNAIRLILTAEAATAFDDLTRSGGVDQLRGQQPNDWPNTFRTARSIPAIEYIRAQRARTLLMQQFKTLMEEWHGFVSPAQGASLTATNLTGHPQIVVPCGLVEGLPAGLLFTGRLFDEGAPMRLALAYQKATKWHLQRPPYPGAT